MAGVATEILSILKTLKTGKCPKCGAILFDTPPVEPTVPAKLEVEPEAAAPKKAEANPGSEELKPSELRRRSAE